MKRSRKHRLSASGFPKHAEASVKVAIDFPAALFEETEAAVRELATTRSSLIRIAVESFLRSRKRTRLEGEIAASFSANAESERQLVEEFKHVDAEFDR
jgi:metal-responsive CopG/Arc/MetJ family transcriptional regulator